MTIFPRTLYPAIKAHVAQPEFTIITGARQVGKTTLLRQLYQELRAADQAVFFYSLEDPRFLEAIDRHPTGVFDFLDRIPTRMIDGVDDAPVFLLLDEIQYAAAPSNLLKFLYDTYAPNLKVIATGSSAFYIDQKFTDSLAGRKRIFHLRSLDFTEFLLFKGAEQFVARMEIKRSRPSYQIPANEVLTGYFYEYLRYGGYPKVVLAADQVEKRLLLNELLTAYLRRDMVEAGVEKANKFFTLFTLLADQIGDLVNRNELANTLQINNKTVDSYLRILRQCFHVELVRPFSRNLRKELTKMPKIYFHDTGIRNILLNKLQPIPQREDRGKLLENFYFRQFSAAPLHRLFYWRTTAGQEVDFLLEDGTGGGQAVEVKWNAAKFNPKKYTKFTDTYPQFPLTVRAAADFWRLD